jgi:hypothetical protein
VTTRLYANPLAFKQAVETRLKNASSTDFDFGRRRQLLVFERFLARIVPVFGDAATLKGGLALELRLDHPEIQVAAPRARARRHGSRRQDGASRRLRSKEHGRRRRARSFRVHTLGDTLDEVEARRERRDRCGRMILPA